MPGLRSPAPRKPRFQCLFGRRTGDHFAGLSGTQQPARTEPDLWRVAQHGDRLAEKKALNAPPLAATVVAAQPDDVLELDELWTFVGHRRRGVIWLWLALCRRTRQIVAYALGPRNDATARLLWARIPPAYRQSLLYTDHLESDYTVLPAAQHQAAYSRGPTHYIERFNNTLRQRLGR